MSKRLEMLDKLIESGSKDPFHHYARALELRSLGQTQAALSALEQVTGEFPEYVPSYLIAAQLSIEIGDTARARALCDQGLLAARRARNDHAQAELAELLAGLPAG
jgi:tetratricopeptide (TPR) repeat protein